MRLIDADKIPWTDLNDNPNSNIKVLITFADKVNRMPTIEERKKGKWIPVTKIYKVTEDQFPKTHIEWVDATEPDEIDGVRCSECGTVYDFIEARNWCSECGARMER